MALLSVCPCCGAPRDVKTTRFDHEFQTISYGGRVAPLRSRTYEAARLLHKVAPRGAYVDWMCEQMGVSPENLRKIIHSLRGGLLPLGLTVRNGRGFYQLTPSMPLVEAVDMRPARAPLLVERAAS